MLGVGRNYKVPISDTLDSNVPLVPSQGQIVPRTTQIPHVEVQAICIEWNNEGLRKRKFIVGKLVPKLKNPENQMEGASEHLKKSAKNSSYSTRARPHSSLVHAGRKSNNKTS